jgi:hypothetical protein
MTPTESDYTAIACIFDTVVANLIPYYLAAAKGDETAAARTVLALIKVHNPVDPPEIELAGRIIGFAAAASDNLRLSMRPGLSDAKVLRYRANAASLDRSAEKCRTALADMQTRRHERTQLDDEPEPAPVPSAKPTAPPKRPAFANMATELAAMRSAMKANSATTTPNHTAPHASAGR